jgi:hypothetical protein
MPLLDSAQVHLSCLSMDSYPNADAGYCNDAAYVSCYGTDDGSIKMCCIIGTWVRDHLREVWPSSLGVSPGWGVQTFTVSLAMLPQVI